jgi:hypothetical protein
MFTVTKNNPIPTSRIDWPFKTMEIDESIEIEDKAFWSKAVICAHITGRQKNMKFSTRWNKAENKGIIWRIS